MQANTCDDEKRLASSMSMRPAPTQLNRTFVVHADGRRLVANVITAQPSLWAIPITSRITEEQDVEALPFRTARAQSPRFGGESLFYLSSRDGADGPAAQAHSSDSRPE